MSRLSSVVPSKWVNELNGAGLETPNLARYPIYLIFPLTAEQQTLEVLQRAALSTGASMLVMAEASEKFCFPANRWFSASSGCAKRLSATRRWGGGVKPAAPYDRLRQNFLYHMARHVGEPEVAALVAVRKPRVVDAQ